MAKDHSTKAIASITAIEQRIHLVRGKRVMVDSDLAVLYEVKTKALNQAYKRNQDRFPRDFAFQLTDEEFVSLRSQSVTSNSSRGGRRTLPFVFTEHGVAMLASVLNSDRAVQTSVAIVRAFVHLRELLVTHADLARRLDDLEKKYDRSFAEIFQAIRQLMTPPKSPKGKIGFDTNGKS